MNVSRDAKSNGVLGKSVHKMYIKATDRGILLQVRGVLRLIQQNTGPEYQYANYLVAGGHPICSYSYSYWQLDTIQLKADQYINS